MNIKNVIKRAGVIFILGPIFILSLLLNVLMILTIIVWGPIYYIICGEDPTSIENPIIDICEKFCDWYLKNFGPK